MDVPGELQKVWIFFTDNGFVTILEKVAASLMAFIESHCITCHKPAHDLTERGWSHAQKEMEMVGDQRPCITLGLTFLKDNGQTIQKGFSILVVPEDFSSFDSSGHYMLQEARGIKSG